MLPVAIGIIVALVVIFIVSFVIYNKTPAPKGCEDLKISDENCANCQRDCAHNPNKVKEEN